MMKVVIAAAGPTLDSLVAQRFGHAPYYLLVDVVTRELHVIENHEDDDETHAIIPQLAGQGAEVFVTGNIGPHAFQLIQSLQGQVALARRMPAGEALDKLQRGELELLSAPTVKHSRHDLHGDHAPHHSA
ncbi:MAG: dinitrogenase iron-molybdenum cofactor biosynthesis protein [Anaerolineales bacterium]|nr:dinitrogenase iron-molybdenum cofactor biosynthesis protein [Anaerolineales bacterium]